MVRYIFVSLMMLVATAYASAQDIPNFDNTISDGEPGQTIAFVAEKIALDKLAYEEHCPGGHICMDARFNTRYRIIDLLEGEYYNETIDFAVYDHYGTPNFSKHDRVVIYVAQAGDQLFHEKYSYDVLSPVKGGGYAVCGDPYAEYEMSEVEKNGRFDLNALEFDPPITFKISDYIYSGENLEHLDEHDIRSNFIETMRRFAPPAFEIEGDVVTCKMGLPADEIALVRMEFEFDPQREFAQKHARCMEQSDLAGKDSYTGLERAASGYDECMAE